MHERTAVRPARDRVEGRVPPRSRSTPEPAGPVAALSRTVGNQASAAELSGGSPLDAATRADMEAGFGRDLGQVRLHTGGAAEQAVSAAGALAYTVGRHIFLGRSGLGLGNTATRHLLAHELSHVVQQERGGIQDPSAPGGAAEARADDAADAVLSGRTAVNVGPGTQVGIARADAGQADGGGAGSSVIAAIGDALSSRLLGAVGLPPGSGVA